MHRNFIQYPPQSTGEKVHTSRFDFLAFDGQTLPINQYDVITGVTSGIVATITEIVQWNPGVSGGLYLNITNNDETDTFLDNEELQIDSVTVALANGNSDKINIQATCIVDGEQPYNKQKVDRLGAASIRFSEGSQQFDAYGNSKHSSHNALSDFTTYYDDLPDEFWNDTQGVGSNIAHTVLSNAVVLTTDVGDGDYANRVTHRYHKLIPGNGQLVNQGVRVGDTGKTNVIREWGYCDSLNGVFFQLNGFDLRIGLRNNRTGIVSTEYIERADWNGDQLIGGPDSTMLLDVSAANKYWFDIQDQAGRIRFGVYDTNGNRVVCHTQCSLNTTAIGQITFPTLPLSWKQYNVGVSGSLSQLVCGVSNVMTEGVREPWGTTVAQVPPDTVTIGNGSFTPIWSMRCKTLLKGAPNRVAVVPKFISVITDTESVVLQIIKNPTLTAPAWDIDVGVESAIEGDTTASAYSGGTVVATMLVSPGQPENINLSKFFDYRGEHLNLHADGVNSHEYCLVGKTISGLTTEVFSSMIWWEIR